MLAGKKVIESSIQTHNLLTQQSLNTYNSHYYWESSVINNLSFFANQELINNNPYIEFLSDVLDTNLFIHFNDYNLVDQFLSNNFINANLQFILGDTTNPYLNESNAVTELSSFLANDLCSSILSFNKWDNIIKVATDLRTNEALGELQIWYDEDAFVVDAIQDIATPESKLYYPEPFIASPSFTHEEIWFIHILHYNYWLWFFFISLIMFYFITFINVVRWCNLRAKPKRETRGVSRSKCADLITACVPVSWAISIIISETVDATDYYDGFGTGELVIGIRAYQWGWEYFYPKNIDLNYNVRPSYSTFMGNSIKYDNASSSTLDSNVLWKYYQKKNKLAQQNTPINLLLTPNEDSNLISNIDFTVVGNSISKDTNAFKKIQKFSKITTNSLNRDASLDVQVFSKINNIYANSSYSSQNDHFYGNPRQHNHASLDSFLPAFSTLVNKKGLEKFLSYSLNSACLLDYNKSGSSSAFFKENFYDQPISNGNSEDALDINGDRILKVDNILKKSFLNSNLFFSKWVLNFYNNYNFNNLSDVKSTSNPFRALIKSKSTCKKNTLYYKSNSNNTTIINDLTLKTRNSFYSWNLFNKSKSYRFKDLNSNNLSFLSADKNTRLLLKKKFHQTDRDINFKTNTGLIQDLNLNLGSNLNLNYINSSLKWLPKDFINKTAAISQTASNANRPPVASTNSFLQDLGYDKSPKFSENEVPSIFSGKEEASPAYLFNTYWSSFYRNTNLQHNYSLLAHNFEKSLFFYFPSILEYSEYDFKNWQALETLEDTIWESTHSAFMQDDYTNIKKNFKDSNYFTKYQTKYNLLNRVDDDLNYKFKSQVSLKAFKNTTKYGTKLNTLNIFVSNFFTNPSSVNLSNFVFYNNTSLFEGLEENYENLKNIKTINFLNYKNTYFSFVGAPVPSSYATVLDSFRADFEENSWNLDSEENLVNFNDLNNNNLDTITNNLKLRSTAKNAIVTYNAIQKVYKSRFDELRSNINYGDFTNSFIKYPFLMEKKSPYENMLFKNVNNFYNANFYSKVFKNNYSSLVTIFNLNNMLFLDIPFLTSMKSDAARYMWFDWQARWSTIEVQPSSIARYSLAGLPYFSKKFEYSSGLGDELNDSENYLTKISRARKNYMPSWAYSMYFYSKVSNWFNYNTFNDFFNHTSMKNSKFLLKNSKAYWKSYSIVSNNKIKSSYSFSGLNRPNVVTWSPIKGLSSHYYNVNILIDILSKREHLYRQYFSQKSNVRVLPHLFTVSPNSNLVKEIQAAYSFIDPTTYSAEITRELLYKNSNFINFLFIKDFLKVTNNTLTKLSLNFSILDNYFLFIFNTSNEHYNDLSKNWNLFKSQYRPMKKGVVNMVRLQATNAVAMPTEIRLHILASSKDVIHSWAIPSAGIKIDCVPGYSSHRVAIFLTHGIFWGQCMEICGRYHHWMPIVVYFMKRDLFFLWCTHFMHYSDIDQVFNMTDKQLTDYMRLVSFDKTTWANEIYKNTNL